MILRSLAPCLLVSAPLVGQTFQITDFSNSARIQYVGNARVAGSAAQLTDAIPDQVGAMWHAQALPVTAGFDTQFTFRIDPGTSRGEGFAFVLQQTGSGAIGQGGVRLGYGGTEPNNFTRARLHAMAIEIDTLAQPGGSGENSDNEISAHLGDVIVDPFLVGASASASLGFDVADGQPHTMRVRYDIDGFFEIFVDNLSSPVLTVDHDLDDPSNYSLIYPFQAPIGEVTVGFTGSTGESPATTSQRVEIDSWSWASQPLAPVCARGNVRDGVSGFVDVLDAEDFRGFDPAIFGPGTGSTPGLRRLTVPSFEPSAVTLDAPPSNVNGATYVLFADLGRPTGAATFPTPFGDLCFAPVSVLPLGSGVAPMRILVPAGLPLLGNITLQGAIDVDPSSSIGLATTNAVTIRFGAPPAPEIIDQFVFAGTPRLARFRGRGFSELATITVAGTATPVRNVRRAEIEFFVPANTPCDAQVVITNPDGQSVTTMILSTPVINGFAPATVNLAGGQPINVDGAGFEDVETVTVGGTPVAFNTVLGLSLITPPAASPGPVPVVMTTFNGCTATAMLMYQ